MFRLLFTGFSAFSSSAVDAMTSSHIIKKYIQLSAQLVAQLFTDRYQNSRTRRGITY